MRSRAFISCGSVLAFSGDAAPLLRSRRTRVLPPRAVSAAEDFAGPPDRLDHFGRGRRSHCRCLPIVGGASEKRWQDFVRRLNSSPGIAVTQAEKNWIRRSRVAGLRDPAVADPAALPGAAGMDPTKLRFEWKDYLALDDGSVLRRFEQRFGKPAGTNLRLTNGALTISGSVPYEWFTRVERDGLQSPGVSSIAENNHS